MATSDNREIPWVIQEQTRVKHALLKQYLAPWMKILWQQQAALRIPQRIIYFDGFAGPGEYWNDSTRKSTVPGSPILAARIGNDLIDQGKGRQLDIIAIENNRETIGHLKPLLETENRHKQYWQAVKATFENAGEDLLKQLEEKKLRLPPTFFFIDPFGYTGYPMSLLARLLAHERTELFVTFMIYDISRFAEQKSFEKGMLSLFGTEDFKNISDRKTPEERTDFIYTLYRKQLLAVGNAKFVLPFRVNTPDQGTRPKYFLFHVSNNIKALRLMKDNMARASAQDFRFEAVGIGPSEQLSLFEPIPEEQIKMAIKTNFEKDPRNWIPYLDIEDWAYVNTAGVAKQIKAALIDMEDQGDIKIFRLPKQRKNTVVKGAKIQFTPKLI